MKTRLTVLTTLLLGINRKMLREQSTLECRDIAMIQSAEIQTSTEAMTSVGNQE